MNKSNKAGLVVILLSLFGLNLSEDVFILILLFLCTLAIGISMFIGDE